MENTKPEELMELIPVEIRHHFVLRKRFIAYKSKAPDFTDVKSKS